MPRIIGYSRQPYGYRSAPGPVLGTVGRYRPGVVRGLTVARTVYNPPALRGRVVPGFTRRGGFYGRYQQTRFGELKFFDTTNDFTFDVTAILPATAQLVLIPQGVTESTRVGRKCVIKSIYMKGHATFAPAAAATGFTVVRLWLIMDKQCNGAAAAFTDIFTSQDVAVALRNLSNSSRFVILKAWVWTFNSPAGVTTAYDSVTKPYAFIKRCNIPLEFSSTTGAITELKSNNIFLAAGADNGDNLVTLHGITRVRFSDN